MINSKNIKRTKRELKYIDVIATLIGLIEGFDCGFEISENMSDLLYDFKINKYELNLIKRIFTHLKYYTYGNVNKGIVNLEVK